MIGIEEKARGQYGFSKDIKKCENECYKCVYLEGLTIETMEKICNICDDFKVVNNEHVRKYEDIKYTRKETIRLLLDI